MTSIPVETEPKIYVAPDVGDLRRIEHLDGISFMTCFLEQKNDENPVSVGVDLHVENDNGNVLLTMRRVAAMPDGMQCVTAAMRLTPEAAADLVQSINMLIGQLKQ